MKAWFKVLWGGTRTLVGSFFSFLLWLLWFALAAALVVQLYIATAHELSVPEFLLRRAESRLADYGLSATFGRTRFDPTGNVLLEDARVFLPGYSEPVLTVRSAFVRLNPLMLVVGQVEPRDIRLTGATLFVPAMVSRTARAEEFVRGLDATIEPGKSQLTLHQLTARIAGVAVAARGTMMLPRRAEKPASAALATFLSEQFPLLCRRAMALTDELARLEEPVLTIELTPSESGAIAMHVTATARAAKLEQPLAASAKNIRASTRLLLFGETPPTHIDVSVEELQLPNATVARDVQAHIAGRFAPGSGQFDLREVRATASAVESAGVVAHAISAQVFPGPLPRIEAKIVARILESRLGLQGSADFATRAAVVRFEGGISPTVLDRLSEHFRVNVRKFYDFDSLTVERGEVRFGADWKFEKLTANVRIPRMNSYGVIMEDGRAALELDPKRFYSPSAFARVGENYARGTYEHEFGTHRYRFLLEGRLRPLAISPWFRDWWTGFFEQLDFAAAPPEASVDVQGFWREGRRTSVFVFADVAKPVIRNMSFDRVRTRLFIRPAFYDALEILATHGAGAARGRFLFSAEPATHTWHTLDFALDSNLDLAVAAKLLGPAGEKSLAPFQLETPPTLKLSGTFTGPAAPGGEREKLRVEARTQGAFRFHDFPLQDVSFIATLDGEEVLIEDIEAMFGGGAAGGRARVWGAGATKRLGFDYALRDAELGQVAGALSEFFAAKQGKSAAAPGKFLREKANVRLDFAASAEGAYHDPLSYRGDGSAVLRGAEIGEVHLLGALSELLKFTSLRFNEARGNFKIEGAKLVFPAVTLRGANSAVDAHGSYSLDRRELDFNAKIFPFQESENLLKSVVGVVLTPLSNALEVKLSGTIEKPEWAFVRGPTNLLRNLAPGTEPKAEGANPGPLPETSAPPQNAPPPDKP